jgi:hypothetical protein
MAVAGVFHHGGIYFDGLSRELADVLARVALRCVGRPPQKGGRYTSEGKTNPRALA